MLGGDSPLLLVAMLLSRLTRVKPQQGGEEYTLNFVSLKPTFHSEVEHSGAFYCLLR